MIPILLPFSYIRILGGRRVRELGGENIIANGKVRLGVFAHYIVFRGHKAGGEIVGADLGRGDHKRTPL